MRRAQTPRTRRDEGVALVMAMGIALIAMTVAVIVIAMTIIASNDSGRDRVRTAEIHTAEAAIDSTMAILQATLPCPSPDSMFDTTIFGSGVSATTVHVDIDYFQDTTPVTCADIAANVSPNRAIITASSTANKEQLGLQPERILEAEVNLDVTYSPGVKAAIFSEAGLGTSAAFLLEPGIGEESADIWIDSGDWTCKGGVGQIYTVGTVYIPAGSFNAQNNCVVDGSVWVQNDLTTSASSESNAISRSITVRSGTLTLAKPLEIFGPALLGGPTDPNLTAPVIYDNVDSSEIPNLTSLGLPQLTWPLLPASRTLFLAADGWQLGTAATLGARQQAAWGGGAVSPCTKWNNTKPVVVPENVSGTYVKTVYDLANPVTGCPGTIDMQRAALELRGDTAIILNGLSVTTSLTVTNPDSAPHKLWIIVPYNTLAGTSGSRGIDSNSTKITFGNVDAFIYAPGSVTMNPHGNFRGQIYGGSVALKNDSTMEYYNVGVPGFNFEASTANIVGYEVELVYKREIS